MRSADILLDFDGFCRVDRQLSDRTARGHVWQIGRLFDALRKDARSITPDDLRSYLSGPEGKAPSTYANALKSLKVFFRDYLGCVEVVHTFRFPKKEFRPKQVPSRSDLQRFYTELDSTRDRALFLLYGTSGLRKNEVLSLYRDDTDLEKRTIVPRKRGTRAKNLNLGSSIVVRLSNLMEQILAIEMQGLTRRFGSLLAVDHVSLGVEEGEVFGLLGPNGAGKTTTIRMLACLLSSSEGSATVNGYDIRKDPLKVRQTVGILTENPSLYERLTAFENMEFFAEAYGLSNRRERIERIRELMEVFKLSERMNDKVAIYSKGMKQKLAIARAIVHDPPTVFLDEPTASLDPESAKEIRDMIHELSQRKRHTILLCTHRLEDAEKLCSRVMIINKGKSIVVGTVDELRDRIGGQPILEVRLRALDQRVVEAVRHVKQVKVVDIDKSAMKLTLSVSEPDLSIPEIFKNIVYAGGMILEANVRRPSLEEIYLKLTEETQEP